MKRNGGKKSITLLFYKYVLENPTLSHSQGAFIHLIHSHSLVLRRTIVNLQSGTWTLSGLPDFNHSTCKNVRFSGTSENRDS